ncbi:MAG TPA: DUF5684 domain-containing protein [Candidatus Saccharimonadales bacterium]|nr:DUF5684 domain-containing protein [Candidatus Saccharimonadales bacterium]
MNLKISIRRKDFMLAALSNFAQDYSYYTYSTPPVTTSSGVSGVFWALLIGAVVLAVFMIVCMWRVFTKAGKPGWAAIIPIYNTLVLLQIVGRPWWWILLFLVSFIPIVGSIVSFIIIVIVYNDLSKSFGKSTGFTVLLVLLPVIGFPILAFGDAKYKGPAAMQGKTMPDAPLPPHQAAQ